MGEKWNDINGNVVEVCDKVAGALNDMERNWPPVRTKFEAKINNSRDRRIELNLLEQLSKNRVVV